MSKIRFHCIACGAAISADPDGAGTFCDCPQCLRATPIPGSAVQDRPFPSPDILAIEIKFRVACCGSKLRVDARSQGQVFLCPHCQNRMQVPIWGDFMPPAAAQSKSLEPASPRVRLSAEECAFLTAPLPAREPTLVASDN